MDSLREEFGCRIPCVGKESVNCRLIIFSTLFIALLDVAAQNRRARLADYGSLVHAVIAGSGGASEADALPGEVEMGVYGTLSFLSREYSHNSLQASRYTVLSAEQQASLYRYLDLSELSVDRSEFFRPVSGRVTSPFGYRPRFRRMHRGVDFFLAEGDTVRAALSGVVRATGYERRGYGYYMIIAHGDGVETLYGHLNSFLLKRGDKVAAGQPLALGGSTGRSTGPHLHFELRTKGYAVNPTEIFNLNIPGHRATEREVERTNVLAILSTVAQMQEELSPAKRKINNSSIAGKHIVRRGDTLTSLSMLYALPVSFLAGVNSLSEDAILFSGQVLRLRPE